MPIKSVLCFAATSAIAQSVLRLYAEEGATLLLIARSADKLAPMIADLSLRGAKVLAPIYTDLAKVDEHESLMDLARAQMANPDLILIAQGVLIGQPQLDRAPTQATDNFHINATSVISLLMHSALWLDNVASEAQPKHIVVLGSVAGEVGRAKMIVYGAAKAAIAHAINGLNGRFFQRPIFVTNIKPGYIASPMTDGIDSALMVEPETVARRIKHGIDKGHAEIYAPAWWQAIMLILKLMPRALLYRFKL